MVAKKPDDRRVRGRRPKPELATVTDLGVQEHKPSSSWLAATVRQWDEFWASELSGQILRTDVPSLVRLFDWRDELERCRRRIRALNKEALKAPLVDGSQGQPVKNPLFGVVASATQEALAIESKIVALEDRLALSPKARLTIGVTQQKGQSLAMANASIAAAIQEAMHDEKDPRASRRKPAKETG